MPPYIITVDSNCNNADWFLFCCNFLTSYLLQEYTKSWPNCNTKTKTISWHWNSLITHCLAYIFWSIPIHFYLSSFFLFSFNFSLLSYIYHCLLIYTSWYFSHSFYFSILFMLMLLLHFPSVKFMHYLFNLLLLLTLLVLVALFPLLWHVIPL